MTSTTITTICQNKLNKNGQDLCKNGCRTLGGTKENIPWWRKPQHFKHLNHPQINLRI